MIRFLEGQAGKSSAGRTLSFTSPAARALDAQPFLPAALLSLRGAVLVLGAAVFKSWLEMEVAG